MHEAALGATPRARDPDTISFVPAVRVLRRTLPPSRLPPPEDQPRRLRAILRELMEERGRSSRGRSSRGRTVPLGVKRKMSSDPLRPRRYRRRPPLDYTRTSLSNEYWG